MIKQVLIGIMMLFVSSTSLAIGEEQVLQLLQSTVKPIQADSITLETPLAFFEPGVWGDLGHQIRDTQATKITLRVEGIGGIVLIGQPFIREIQDAQKNGKTINMDIIGPAYSMHAFITCYADKVSVRPGASIMFHSMGQSQSYLFGLVTTKNIKLDKSSEIMQDAFFGQCIKNKILTGADADYIKKGGDVIISNVDGILIKSREMDVEGGFNGVFDIVLAIGLMSSIVALTTLIIKRVK